MSQAISWGLCAVFAFAWIAERIRHQKTLRYVKRLTGALHDATTLVDKQSTHMKAMMDQMEKMLIAMDQIKYRRQGQ